MSSLALTMYSSYGRWDRSCDGQQRARQPPCRLGEGGGLPRADYRGEPGAHHCRFAAGGGCLETEMRWSPRCSCLLWPRAACAATIWRPGGLGVPTITRQAHGCTPTGSPPWAWAMPPGAPAGSWLARNPPCRPHPLSRKTAKAKIAMGVSVCMAIRTRRRTCPPSPQN
jgi:hypothetical protein